jgi:hypothetical protein
MVLSLFILILPIVAVVAWWLKHRYTVAIVRLQQVTRPIAISEEHSVITRVSEAISTVREYPTLRLSILPAHEVRHRVDQAIASQRLRARVLSLQFTCALLYWCAVLILLQQHASFMGGGGLMSVSVVIWWIGPTALLPLIIPPCMAWMLQAGVRRTLMNVAALGLLSVGLVLLVSEAHWDSVSGQGFVFGYASIAIIVSAFLRPSVRGAGLPLVAASGVSLLVLSTIVALAIAFAPDDSAEDTLGPTADSMLAIIAIVVMIAGAVLCGWWVMKRIALRYAAKRFSDLQIALATYWMLMTVFALGTAARDSTMSVRGFMHGSASRKLISEMLERYATELAYVSIIVLFLLFRWLQSRVLRRLVGTAGSSADALLFLRVFKPSRRSEEFTDRFFAYWRFAGPVWMIAGPDLAGAYMEPNEFFAYVRGHLRDHFVSDPGEVAARVDALDNIRDPDGRFRINELYCADDTWRPTVLHMVDRASVVLLDLREYSNERAGTRYELTELLRRAPLNKAILLIDAKDDVSRLSEEIEAIWRQVGAQNVNVAPDSAEHLRILQFAKGSNAEMHGLFYAVAEAVAVR